VLATALTLCTPRARRPLLLFPEAVGPEPEETGSLEVLQAETTGFWTIYDELAVQDSVAMVAGGGPMSSALFSTNMVLRADGQASRGSAFPGGEWSIVEDGGRRRLKMVLRSRLLQQERRYDGLLFSLSMSEGQSMPQDAVAKASMGGDGLGASQDGSPSLRVVGTVTAWNSTSPNSEGGIMIGGSASFSMVKLALDRKKLIPTIRPWSRELSPEEMEEEMRTQRAKDTEDADEIRQLLEDVRRAKRDGTWKGPSGSGAAERPGLRETEGGKEQAGERPGGGP
jgi:hypothetical protein